MTQRGRIHEDEEAIVASLRAEKFAEEDEVRPRPCEESAKRDHVFMILTQRVKIKRIKKIMSKKQIQNVKYIRNVIKNILKIFRNIIK